MWRLTDFGNLVPKHLATGEVAGTPGYAATENGNLDSDLINLWLVLKSFNPNKIICVTQIYTALFVIQMFYDYNDPEFYFLYCDFIMSKELIFKEFLKKSWRAECIAKSNKEFACVYMNDGCYTEKLSTVKDNSGLLAG